MRAVKSPMISVTLMAGFGKSLQRMEHDHEPEMQVGTRWIDAEFDAQRTPGASRSRNPPTVST